jgi:hypothetical protein
MSFDFGNVKIGTPLRAPRHSRDAHGLLMRAFDALADGIESNRLWPATQSENSAALSLFPYWSCGLAQHALRDL